MEPGIYRTKHLSQEYDNIVRYIRFEKVTGHISACLNLNSSTWRIYNYEATNTLEKWNITLATPEEEEWFLECEKQGRFVPKEEIKSNNYQIY